MVSAIIPAFNEREYIKGVIEAVLQSPSVDEVIVVDDGSTDGTSEIVKETQAILITLETNQGKAAAMERGVREAKNEVIVFVDSDLVGLEPRHIEMLTGPVLKGRTAMFVGITDKSQLWLNRIIRFLPLISGSRAMKKDVWYSVPDKYRQGFQIEVALNYFCRRKVGKLGFTLLDGVKNTVKEKKYGLMTGLWRRIGMTGEVAGIIFKLHIVKRVFGKK